MAENTLSITDNRTGKTYEIPIADGTIRAMDLRQIKVTPDEFGMMTFDPAYLNTASCRSSITFIDGGKGILRYRGYPIEQLAEGSNFLEVAYLLVHGELPAKTELESWKSQVMQHASVDESLARLVDSLKQDAHPMGALMSAVSALSTLYPDAKTVGDAQNRMLQLQRMIAKIPTLAAYTYRHSKGLSYVDPDNELSYAGNFLRMMFKKDDEPYTPNKTLEHALDVLFILHADHEQNCSTSTVRAVGSSNVDMYSAISAGIAALYGPRHGGANEAVIRMLERIGDAKNIPGFIKDVKNGDKLLMGFGHRVYKNYDPRAKIIKQLAHEVFEVMGKNPLLDIAMALEKIALEDEYFVKRKLYPNVDFYSGLIYQSMGFPTSMFTVLFAIGRTSGWLAQWNEMMGEEGMKIARPRQIYTGSEERAFVPLDKR